MESLYKVIKVNQDGALYNALKIVVEDVTARKLKRKAGDASCKLNCRIPRVSETDQPSFRRSANGHTQHGCARWLCTLWPTRIHRTFEASEGENSSGLLRHFIRLLSSSTDGGGQFEFMSYRHTKTDSDTNLSHHIDAIAQKWVKKYVTPTEGEEEDDLEVRREYVKKVMTDKLSTFSSTTITYLGAFAAVYEYDYILAGMLDEYWSNAMSELTRKVTIPLAPSDPHVFEFHADRLHHAVKSKLRGLPLQRSLSAKVLQRCERLLPGYEKSAIDSAHPDLYNLFIGTSYTAYKAGDYDDAHNPLCLTTNLIYVGSGAAIAKKGTIKTGHSP